MSKVRLWFIKRHLKKARQWLPYGQHENEVILLDIYYRIKKELEREE